jgi:hypothetical protein
MIFIAPTELERLMTTVGAACEYIIVGATCCDSAEDATGIPQVGQAASPCMTCVPHLLHLESMFRKILPLRRSD